MIKECPINFECKVIRYISNITSEVDMFIAEIVEVYVGKQYLTEMNEVNITKVTPILIGSDRNYWVLGNHVAEAFSEGKNFKK